MTLAQNLPLKADLYKTSNLRYQFDLSENKDYCYLKMSYVPTNVGPGTLTTITNLELTDFRPHNYTGLSVGYIPSSGASSFDGTAYFFYNGKTDEIVIANTTGNIRNKLTNALPSFGLGTTEARTARFQQMKSEDVPTEVAPVVDVLVDNSQLRLNFLTKIVLWLGYAFGVVLSLMICYFLFKRFVR